LSKTPRKNDFQSDHLRSIPDCSSIRVPWFIYQIFLKTICIEIFEIMNSNTFVRVGLCNRIRFPNYVNKVMITDSQRNYIRQNNMFRV
jgi:hypothetical protein